MPAVRLPDPPLSDGEIVLRAWRLSDVPALTAAARAVDGTAEAIPLRPASADAVTVAQAFHWFDGDAALAEIHRVLRSGGTLALVWNRRRMDDPLNRAVEELIAPYRGHTPALRTNAWRAAFERTDLFGPLEEHAFPNDQSLDADGLVDRVASISFIASLDEAARADVLQAVRALAGDGRVTIRHDTEVHLSERLGGLRAPCPVFPTSCVVQAGQR